MRLSAKSRYALVATTSMAQMNNNEYITLISISEKFGISKMYLEQVFSLLKHSGIVNSIKGSQGGYQLSSKPETITVYDILSCVETSLFEVTQETIKNQSPEIEAALNLLLFQPLDNAFLTMLKSVTLYDLVNEANKHNNEQSLMFFI